jgi:hypothetical protein
MEQLGSHWTDFHEIWFLSIFRNSVQIIKVSLNSDKNNGYFTPIPMYIHANISPSSTENENCYGQICIENHNIYFMFNNVFPKIVPCIHFTSLHFTSLHLMFDDLPFSYFASLLLMWKNVVQLERPRKTIKYGSRALHATYFKATNTHSEYVILVAFPRQNRLHERASVLRYTYNTSSCM